MDSNVLNKKSRERTFVITGGNSGLGYRCAQCIAAESRENHVILASRNVEKSQQAADRIIRETLNPHLYALPLNLASMASIRAFGQQFVDGGWPPLYGLACNAIAGSSRIEYTEDGFEMMFGTGHLGHFLLTHLLLPNMRDDGRIVFVSSDQHHPPWLLGRLRYTDAFDLAYPKGGNHALRYSGTKLCNLYCTYEMAARMAGAGRQITVNAFNPGFMADTGLADRATGVMERMAKRVAPLLARWMGTGSSSEQSGRWLAAMLTDLDLKGVTGKYFDRGRVAPSSELSYRKEYAVNLWERSMGLVGMEGGYFGDRIIAPSPAV
jgi:NAD(P)-dependent dehydrogenase (short-subunit alcohol dehydrogenase family)